MEAEAAASGAALSALCWLPSVLLAFLVLLSAFMPQTGCPAIGHIFFLYISLYTYINLFFFGQYNCPVPAAWAALNEKQKLLRFVGVSSLPLPVALSRFRYT